MKIRISNRNNKEMNLRFGLKSIFYVSILIWIFSSIFFGRTTISEVYPDVQILYKYGRNITYIFLGGYVFFDYKMNIKKFSYACFMGGVIICSALLSGEIVVISLLIFALGSKRVSIKKTVEIYMFAHLMIVLSVTFLSVIGFIPANNMNRGLIQRYSFGFMHPNTLGIEILVIFMSYMYLHWETRNICKIGMISCFSFFYLWLANCRTDICILVFALVFWRVFRKPGRTLGLFFVGNFLFVLVVIISAYSMFWYMPGNNRTMDLINKIISGRFTLSAKAYNEHGIAWLGRRLDVNMLDNSYVRLLILNGGLFVGVLFIFLELGMVVFYRLKMKKEMMILSVFIILSFMENTMFRVEYNFSIIIIGQCLLQGRARGNTEYACNKCIDG